jgi:hypothetical protein
MQRFATPRQRQDMPMPRTAGARNAAPAIKGGSGLPCLTVPDHASALQAMHRLTSAGNAVHSPLTECERTSMPMHCRAWPRAGRPVLACACLCAECCRLCKRIGRLPCRAKGAHRTTNAMLAYARGCRPLFANERTSMPCQCLA